MRKARSEQARPARSGRFAARVGGAAVMLAPLFGCVTTHTIPLEELPAALEPGSGKDQRRVVLGEDGKPTELPSPAHLRTVEIQTRDGAGARKFEAPVIVKRAGGSLIVEGKDAVARYRVSDVTSVRLRHDDHKTELLAGVLMVSVGVTALANAAVVTAVDFSTCKGECFTGMMSFLVGVPVGGTGLLLTIPGAILTARGAGGLGVDPAEGDRRPAAAAAAAAAPAPQPTVPHVSIGPGSAVVTLPF